MNEEKIWDKFTDLKYPDMATIAEEAVDGLYIFQCSDFNKGFERASRDLLFTYKKDYRLFTTMILECAEAGYFDLTNDDQWCLLDLSRDCITTNYDLLEMITDYETEIVEYLSENKDLLEEFK